MVAYFAFYSYYLWGVIKTALRARKSKQRFTAEKVVIILLMSLCTVIMAAIPIQNKTLKFVSQNGVVNLYMFVMAYFFEPFSADDFSYAKEGDTDFDSHITTGSSGSGLDKSRLSSGSGSRENADNEHLNEISVEMTDLPFENTARALNFNERTDE